MEDPVSQAVKKKPAFAFWGERQGKESTSSSSSATPASISDLASASTCSSASPSTLRRIDALEQRGSSVSPSMQRTASCYQQAGSSSGVALSGVQRLIQQYQTGAAAAPAPNSVSLDRSLSGGRLNASPSPQSSRIALSSSPRSSISADATLATGTSAGSPLGTSCNQSQVPPQSPSLSAQPSTFTLASSETWSNASSSATPTSRLSSAASASDASCSARTLPAPAKQADTQKARRRRRLLQEQLRKRNIKRRSAGAIQAGPSARLSSEDQEQAVVAEADCHQNHPSAPSDLPSDSRPHPTDTRRPYSSSRHPPLISELSNTNGGRSPAESDTYRDAHSPLVTPCKATTRTATTRTVSGSQSKSSTGRATARRPSFDETRPWLELSPLLPDSELLESPEKSASAPGLPLLGRKAPSDLADSACQNSAPAHSDQAWSVPPCPWRSHSASLLASDNSSLSPTALGFSTPPGYSTPSGYSTPPGYPSASSYLSINSPNLNQSPTTRVHRNTALPPPRPTPQTPLPLLPSLASSTASSTARHASTATAGPTRSPPSSSIPNLAPPPWSSHQAHLFGSHALRSRNCSLEQELNSTDANYQHLPQLPIVNTAPAQTSALSPLTSPTDKSYSDTASTFTLAMIRQRSNSLQRKHSTANPTPTQQVPLTLAEVPSTRSSQSSSNSSSTLGRPRGFTVGAIPRPSSTLRSSSETATVQHALKSRPRSLLSNQIFPLDLAEPRYKSRSGRDDEDSARKTYSMDIDRRVSFLTNNPSSSRGGSAVGISRGLSATCSNEREASRVSNGAGGSGERLASESTDRRPSLGGRSRSGSSASLLQQVKSQPKSHASFVIAVVGHAHSGKSTVIKKGLRQFGLSKPHVLSERVTSHSTVCVVDQEQRTIEVLEIDASVLLNGPSKRFAWPKFLPHIDAVILCYDASEIASFRGMSELLENFAVANLSTVMLACKSEVHPKAVDPYYASDMACIYNVGLAECTVQSEEGKKRMRDCFSYLVKEVAKSRSGRARRGPASTVPPISSTAMASQRSQSPGAPPGQVVPQTRAGSITSQTGAALPGSDAVAGSGEQLPMPAALFDSMHARGYSNASSALSRATAAGGSEASIDDAFMASALHQTRHATGNIDLIPNSIAAAHIHTQSQIRTAATSASDSHFTPRKMSSATVASAISDAPSFQSEDNAILHDSLQRAQMGLQNARSSGGYVSIEELWDKLFHAAISRTDERFVTMFMVFFRGFATPMDLLQQMMARFETLTAEDVADGLVHRFALIRLTNMLGDWVLDYPGDLSHPETHAFLVKYHRQLLHHPDTVHTAAQIHAAVDATANAVDLDALWSKAVNSDQTQHKGGIAAAITSASSQQQQQVGEADSASSLPVSHSSSSTSGLMSSLGNNSHDFDGSRRSAEDASESHERTGSESSLPTHPEIGNGARSRSASDLTTSSTEGAAVIHKDGKATWQAGTSIVSGHTQTSSSSTSNTTGTATNNPSSSSAASSSANLNDPPSATTIPPAPARMQDQKSTLRSISNTLMEIDDEVIATELTHLEWTYFTAIQPRDLLRHILVPHDKRDGPVSRSICHFNYISNWVCSMILAQGKTKHRARMLEKFMNIASILRHGNNYGSLNSVLGGLSKTAVHRLKHTRELLKGKSVNKAYQSLVRLMSNERSSAAYRLALENSDGPTIPYVGVHLQDILSISDGNPSKRQDGMIHWAKFSLMDEAVMAVAKCQQYDRYFKSSSAVQRLVVDLPVMDDEALYERSLLVEPRNAGGGATGVGGVAGSKIKDFKSFLSSQTYSAAGFHA
ncbi:hypothetical protein NDA18_004617 [Ustilago nuda]|nr:hypothetical protein NDA18_004617 [Ustilago nuda]